MEPGEFVDMRVLRWSTPVEVLRARYTAFEFPTHAHAEFTIGEVLSGSEVFRHRGREVEAPGGRFIHLNPDEAHDGRAGESSWSYVVCYPDAAFIARALPELCAEGGAGFTTPVSFMPERRGMIARFAEQVFEGEDDLTLQAGLVEIIRVLMPRKGARLTGSEAVRSDAVRSDAVAQVRERLREEWDRNISLIALAESVSLTPLALLRAFREQVGCTPQTFRTARRLAVARELLRAGTGLTDVALRCGFADQAHFTNTFRRWTGITPGQYRRGLQRA